MATNTVFNVVAEPNQTTGYNSGDKVTISITGGAVGPDIVQNMTVNLSLTAEDGSTGTATVEVPFTKAGPLLNVKITKVTDDGNRTWTIATDGKSTSATV